MVIIVDTSMHVVTSHHINPLEVGGCSPKISTSPPPPVRFGMESNPTFYNYRSRWRLQITWMPVKCEGSHWHRTLQLKPPLWDRDRWSITTLHRAHHGLRHIDPSAQLAHWAASNECLHWFEIGSDIFPISYGLLAKLSFFFFFFSMWM